MRIHILTILLSLFLASTSYAEIDGFRGVKWGTSLANFQGDLVYIGKIPEGGGMEMYTRKDEKLSIGDIEVSRIEYFFWQDKFCNVIINVFGLDAFLTLKDTVTNRLKQKPAQYNPYILDFHWYVHPTSAAMSYNEFSDKGYLILSSVPIEREREALSEKQAQEGAADF